MYLSPLEIWCFLPQKFIQYAPDPEAMFITVYHHHNMITTGLVWQYTRSSMTYPIMLPPFCDPVDGHLLLDGCFVNNMPGLTICVLNTPTS